MIRALRHRPVGQKLTFIALLTNGAALTLAFFAFMAHEVMSFRSNTVADHKLTARMLGDQSASALAFNDARGATRILNSVAVHSQVDGAVLLDASGRVFARYRREGASEPRGGVMLDGGHRWSRDFFEIFDRVSLGGKRVGTLYLYSELGEMRNRVVISGCVGLAVLVAAAYGAYVVTRRLQRSVTAPVAHLAQVAMAVASGRNYSVRAIKQSDDELGALVEAFNRMLDQIELGDRALREAHDRLELRVEERTRELQQEIAERRRSEAALHESHERLQLVTRATADAVWDCNPETGALWWNENYQALFGYPTEDVAATADDWRARIHPEDEPAVTAGLKAALNERKKLWSAEYRYRRHDGSYAHVFDRGSILRDPEGKPVRIIGALQDISERKRAQEEIAREKARLQFIFESVPVGISLDDVRADGTRTRFINDAHLRIGGLSREDAVDGAFARITDPADYARQCELRDRLDRGEINRFTLEKRYRRPDGQTVWVVFTLERRPDGNGGWHHLSTVVDISDLKRVQEEAASERARFKFIFDSVPVGISLVHSGDGETHVVNPAHARITGIMASELKEPNVFARATHPDDYARQQPLVQRYKRGEIDRFSLEKRYIHRDGRIVWASLTRRMFHDPATGQKQSITTIVDISELKAAQEAAAREQARFKFIFESVPIGISLVLPSDQGMQLVNPAHVQITGVSMEDSKRPGIFASVTHPDDWRRQEELVQKYAAGQIDHFSLEKRYLHAGGAIVWAAMTSRMFTDPITGGKVSVTTLVDVTERKLAEAKLAETHKQLLDTSRQAGMAEVATGVLHNVGNVLNSVNVSATLLTDIVRQSKTDRVAKLRDLIGAHENDLATFFTSDPRGRQVPGYLQTLSSHLTKERDEVLGELESLRKNIDHIKDIVAMQQSYARVSGVTETVPITELIDDALRMNAGAFERHGVKLVRDFQASPLVSVQKHKVLQILVNLLRNAKYACDDGGRPQKQVTLRLECDRGRVRVTVIDNGIGIPAENLTRIFAHGFTTRKNGHGFGLHSGAIAARELGGALTAYSEGLGRGATFVLDLPEWQEVKAA